MIKVTIKQEGWREKVVLSKRHLDLLHGVFCFFFLVKGNTQSGPGKRAIILACRNYTPVIFSTLMLIFLITAFKAFIICNFIFQNENLKKKNTTITVKHIDHLL